MKKKRETWNKWTHIWFTNSKLFLTSCLQWKHIQLSNWLVVMLWSLNSYSWTSLITLTCLNSAQKLAKHWKSLRTNMIKSGKCLPWESKTSEWIGSTTASCSGIAWDTSMRLKQSLYWGNSRTTFTIFQWKEVICKMDSSSYKIKWSLRIIQSSMRMTNGPESKVPLTDWSRKPGSKLSKKRVQKYWWENSSQWRSGHYVQQTIKNEIYEIISRINEHPLKFN